MITAECWAGSFAALFQLHMKRLITLLLPLAFVPSCFAQYTPPDGSALQGLIVERYYVADANDAADTDGGPGLLEGAVTYRVFVDLLPGYELLTVGGFQNHPMTISTSTTFFNNEDRGEAWGYAINDIHLDVNTVAIDSWLTIGGASDAHWGILKTEDPDGSVAGIQNNDGGSTGTPLLVNDDASAGSPLTVADGLWVPGPPPMVNAVGTAPNLFDPGGDNTYTDANYAWAVLGGVAGPDTTNRILIGQFTTAGVLSYCLNIFVKIPDSLVCPDPACHDFLVYYANLLPTDTGSVSPVDDNIFTRPTLCYESSAPVADCEGVLGGPALPGTACDDGNADTQNDTYTANCDCLGEDCEGTPGGPALPGTSCDDDNPDTSNDMWLTNCDCEGSVGINEHGAAMFTISPNPARDHVRVNIEGLNGAHLSYELLDVLGARVAVQDLGTRTSAWSGTIDMSGLPQGLYFLHVSVGEQRHIERIIKF